jgi:tRNA(Ile)-lysidine synthase
VRGKFRDRLPLESPLVTRQDPPRRIRLHPFETEVARLLRRERLARDGDGVVVALSGGPDSTALLLALAAVAAGPGPRLRLVAAHLDHGLRRGSAADARAARALSRSLGIPFRSARLRGLRRRARGSLERAAREARYGFLARVALREKARAVATAHHRDDRAETVLHRLLQGTALAGMAGVPLRRPLPGAPGVEVIRPLFETGREAVLAYLRERRVVPRRDPTNLDGSNARSRLRTRILPPVLDEYPHAAASLLRLERLAREALGILDREARAAGGRFRRVRGAVSVPRATFEGRGPEGVRRLLREALRRLGTRPPEPPLSAVERLAEALAEVDGRTRRVPVRDGIEVAVGPATVRVGTRPGR